MDLDDPGEHYIRTKLISTGHDAGGSDKSQLRPLRRYQDLAEE